MVARGKARVFFPLAFFFYKKTPPPKQKTAVSCVYMGEGRWQNAQ